MTPYFDIVIPARLDSRRLPGKVLKDIAGKPLIQRVYECATESRARTIIIATDSIEIRDVADSFGAEVIMTKSTHACGTDRIAEVADIVNWPANHLVVNLQGDEPRMPAVLINQTADLLISNPSIRLASLCSPITDSQDLFNPNIVKVVRNVENIALYFSRSPIPFHQDNRAQRSSGISAGLVYRHIGIYSYRASYLRDFAVQAPAPIEKQERLEQLRALWNNEPILVGDASDYPGPGIDVPTDLAIAIQHFASKGPTK